MLPITKNLLTNRRTRPALRNRNWYSIRKLKGIVVHWTANTAVGADARGNRQFFNTTNSYASAHYIVDDHSIIQCLPDNEVGYHVGNRYYQPMGKAIIADTPELTPNYFLLGIEMCVNEDGNWQKTYQNSVELTQHLINKYEFTLKDLYRHYDITGKDCPKMMIEEQDWQAFRSKVNEGLNHSLGTPIQQGEVNTLELNVRSGNNAEFPKVGELHMGDKITIYEERNNWYRIGNQRWVHKHYVKILEAKRLAIVNDPTGLNVRSGPGVNFSIIDVLRDGSQIEIFHEKNNWYNVGVNQWVYAPLVIVQEMKKGKVTAPNFLNVRTGPGTEHPIVKKVPSEAVLTIFENRRGWYRVGEDEWVYGVFIEIIG